MKTKKYDFTVEGGYGYFCPDWRDGAIVRGVMAGFQDTLLFQQSLEEECWRVCEYVYDAHDGWEWMAAVNQVYVYVAPHGEEGPPDRHIVGLEWELTYNYLGRRRR